jgi:hypothetical protein
MGRNNGSVKRSAAQIIRGLYRDVDGVSLHGPAPDGRQIPYGRGLVYGELTTAGVTELARYLELSERDVFYDIGSGVGKLVLQLAITIGLKKCVGIEIAQERYEASCSALEAARELGLIRARHCSFRHENALVSDMSDATIVYTCSTCFPAATLYQLARKVAELPKRPPLITLQPLHPRKPRGLELIDGIELPTSWNPRQSAFVYRVG